MIFHSYVSHYQRVQEFTPMGKTPWFRSSFFGPQPGAQSALGVFWMELGTAICSSSHCCIDSFPVVRSGVSEENVWRYVCVTRVHDSSLVRALWVWCYLKSLITRNDGDELVNSDELDPYCEYAYANGVAYSPRTHVYNGHDLQTHSSNVKMLHNASAPILSAYS